MNISKIPPFEKDLINVIIETTRGSIYKYDFNPEYEVFRLNKAMPLGMAFPFDFGFIPCTKGEDGDPLDVLVLMDEPAIQGALVECRLLGILEAIQREHDGSEVRNDRIVGVANRSIRYKSITDLKHLNEDMVTEIENFFKQYNALVGKEFRPIGWKNEDKARKSIREQTLKS